MTKVGFDHGAGHPLLLVCNAKALNYRKNKAFNDLAYYSEWPKVAGAVIKAQKLVHQATGHAQTYCTQGHSRGVPGEAVVPAALYGGSDRGRGKGPLSAPLGCALRRLGLCVRTRRDGLVSGGDGLGTAGNRGQYRQAARAAPRARARD